MRLWLMAFASMVAALSSGCSGGDIVGGGGATFIDPIMQKWSHVYYDLHGGKIDYSKSGSSDGIRQMTEGNLDFACSDAPMKKDQVAAAKAKGGDVVHVPLIMGAIAVVYNLPDIVDLKLTGSVLADIYLGKVNRWNDSAIAALNPGVALPDREIVPVYRSEGSGTTNVFTEYLNKASREFAEKIPAGTQPKWPQIGLGQKGNDGVAGHVQKNVGCIGYVEVSFAKLNNLPTALLRNAKGRYTAPESANVSAAAEWAIGQKQTKAPYNLHELTYSLTDAETDTAYPICGISYGVLYLHPGNPSKTKTMIAFLKWAATEGQQYAERLHYAPLPESLSKKVVERLGQIE
jgi:phosphate transport system substrate-binding protein